MITGLLAVSFMIGAVAAGQDAAFVSIMTGTRRWISRKQPLNNAMILRFMTSHTRARKAGAYRLILLFRAAKDLSQR